MPPIGPQHCGEAALPEKDVTKNSKTYKWTKQKPKKPNIKDYMHQRLDAPLLHLYTASQCRINYKYTNMCTVKLSLKEARIRGNIR